MSTEVSCSVNFMIQSDNNDSDMMTGPNKAGASFKMNLISVRVH